LHDVWYSEDGEHWIEATSGSGPEGKGLAALGKRAEHACFSLDGKLWLVGGAHEPKVNGDIWWTTDGSHWTKAVDEAPFGTVTGHHIVNVNDEVLLVGGQTPWTDRERGGDGEKIWASTDGIVWHPYLAWESNGGSVWKPNNFVWNAKSAWDRLENSEVVALDGMVWALGPPLHWVGMNNKVWMFDPTQAQADPIP
ncbi:MAG: hypothetical protein IIB38_09940, partial [Candidatus Hydrogenedentes bacterium]|nr:hypothetical protein [Candidatus Hydrogenedentota bacterium]